LVKERYVLLKKSLVLATVRLVFLIVINLTLPVAVIDWNGFAIWTLLWRVLFFAIFADLYV
jgi:hypothetical protein